MEMRKKPGVEEISQSVICTDKDVKRKINVPYN